MLSNFRNKASGFSLIEMAIVMLIMGSILSGLLVALTQTTESTKRTTARNQLLKIEEALYSFAQTHGRLPCPATFTSAGFEDPIGGGLCTQSHGFVPSASLSLYSRVNNDGLMLDPWTNPYRYSIANYEIDANGFYVDDGDGLGTHAFADSLAISALYNKDITDPDNESQVPLGLNDIGNTTFSWQSLLRVCDASDSCPNMNDSTLTSVAPAVVVSMGRNWADMVDDCVTGTNDNENANGAGASDGDGTPGSTYCLTNSNTFVEAEYNEDNFDDMVLWLSPYILFSRMIESTQLP